MQDLIYSIQSQMKAAELVSATINWQQKPVLVRGLLANGILPERDRLLVELSQLKEKPPDWEDDSLWVDLSALEKPTVVVRSDLWVLPENDGRDYALRTLLFSLCDWLRVGCSGVDLAVGQAGVAEGLLELLFWVRVPVPDTLEYLQKLRNAQGGVTARRLPYHSPTKVLYQLQADAKERVKIAHSAGNLAGWFSGNLIWSVFTWHRGCLYHGVQFSLNNRYEKIVVRNFGLKSVNE